MPLWWTLFLADIPKVIKKTVHITKAFLRLEHYCCQEAAERSGEARGSALVGGAKCRGGGYCKEAKGSGVLGPPVGPYS